VPAVFLTAPVTPLGWSPGTATLAQLTDVSPSQPLEVPPIAVPGTKLRIRAMGGYSTSATGSNITWGIYYAASYATAIGSAAVLGASAATASVSTTSVVWPWWLDYEGVFTSLTTAAAGATGSITGQGQLWLPSSLTAWACTPFPLTAALRTVAVDTSQYGKLSMGITLSSTTGIVGLTCTSFNAELIGG
jgi:hypothetical protein